MKISTAGKISTTIKISVAAATLAVAGLSGCASDAPYNSRPVYGSNGYYGPETGFRAAYGPGADPYYSRYEYYPSRESGYYPSAGRVYPYEGGDQR
jgi:hypothetical protein